MHGNDGGLVGVKVDEPVAGRLTGELVRHHLEAEIIVNNHKRVSGKCDWVRECSRKKNS